MREKHIEEKNLSGLIKPKIIPNQVIRVRTKTKTNEDGSITKEKEFECSPSIKDAKIGATIGLGIADPIGAMIGGTLGAIFGPED